MKRIWLSGTSLLLTALLSSAPAAEGPKPPKDGVVTPKTEPQAGKAPKANPELVAKIKKLIERLGHNDYDQREAAARELLKIGRAALPRLKAAKGDKDVERSARAGELYQKIESMPDPSKTDRNSTSGWMAVCGDQKQVQTFEAPADLEIETIRFRAARGYNMPGEINVELRKLKEEKDADPLASGTVQAAWTTDAGKTRGVNRFMNWFEVKVKAKLKKGETYRLVFASSSSGKSNPWLVNCLYRDVFKAGAHLRLLDGKTEKLGAYDLVFQLCSKGEVKIATTTSPKIDLAKREHFGLGHDGTDMKKAKPDAAQFGPGLL